MTRTRYISIW